MPRRIRGYLVTSCALMALLLAFGGAGIASAHPTPSGGAQSLSLRPSAQPAVARLVNHHVVNMRQVPAASATALHAPVRQLPLLTGVSPVVYAQRKAAALHNPNAPADDGTADSTSASAPATPTTSAKFAGQGDTCGCQPPDQALAASPSWVFQGVNTSFAVYSTAGALQSGWPKLATSFFGVPNPGSCSPSGAFVSDPRAFYDPTDQRFWAAMLEVEGAFGINNCPERTYYWVAVSQTNNPNGAWNVYAFNMAAGTTNAADYTEFGFDQQAIYFSGNMFNQAGSAYEYAESFSALKSTMESGGSVTAYGFVQFKANGVLVDTVQPVENEASTFPGAGLLINSFNINGSGSSNCSTTSCKGLVVWAIANPGTSTVSATGFVIASTKTYIAAPQADEPGSPASIETLDTRISGTPVFQQGLISFALETGKKNTTQVVPAILWGQVQPTISGGAITGATVHQSGYISFSGDRAASFGALMATGSGNLLMVFDTMSSTIDPSIMYTTRLTTDKLGTFESKVYLRKGTVATSDSRWGDYEACSYDGTSTNHTWFAAQYSNGDWATEIGEVTF